jgi:hypothetical protein
LNYKYYNARGKELKNEWNDKRWMKFVVEEVWPSEDGVVINVGVTNDIIERMAGLYLLEPAAANMAYGDVKVEGDTVTLDNIQWLAGVIPQPIYHILGNNRAGGTQYEVDLMAQTRFSRRMAVGDSLPDEKILDVR